MNEISEKIPINFFRFKILETLDTAFYECRATNGIDTISSVAIITVELNKGGFKSRKNNGFVSGNSDYDDIGLLPETYSEPDFTGMGAGGPSFEGGQKPTNFGTSRFDQRHQDNSQKSPNNQNDLKRLGETIPNLKPNERSGTYISFFHQEHNSLNCCLNLKEIFCNKVQ